MCISPRWRPQEKYTDTHAHTHERNAPGVQNISEKSIRTIIELYFIDFVNCLSQLNGTYRSLKIICCKFTIYSLSTHSFSGFWGTPVSRKNANSMSRHKRKLKWRKNRFDSWCAACCDTLEWNDSFKDSNIFGGNQKLTWICIKYIYKISFFLHLSLEKFFLCFILK